MDIELLNVVINQFNISISNVTFKSISQGYINDTFLVKENSNPKYVLQRINGNVFKNVAGLHKNINLALKKLKANDYNEFRQGDLGRHIATASFSPIGQILTEM